MNTVVMIAAATMGQFFDCPPPPICQPPVVYTTPVYTAPVDYVFLELDGMRERTRSYELIEYGTKKWRVPVINGYVPDVSWCKLNSGGYKIRYDYSARTPLDECVLCEKFVPARSNEPRQTSRGGALLRMPPEPMKPAPIEEIRPEPRRTLSPAPTQQRTRQAPPQRTRQDDDDNPQRLPSPVEESLLPEIESKAMKKPPREVTDAERTDKKRPSEIIESNDQFYPNYRLGIKE